VISWIDVHLAREQPGVQLGRHARDLLEVGAVQLVKDRRHVRVADSAQAKHQSNRRTTL
jgi:hypothetical protein